jgi:hypothetical protein
MSFDTFKSELFDQIKKQGLSFILLTIFSYHFYIQVEKLEVQVRQCELEYRTTLLQMINDNTKAIHEFRETLDENE